jgi:hypothetical protein
MSTLRDFARIPVYPWLIASYPSLQLLAHNVTQVGTEEVLRPLLASWLVTTILYLLALRLLKDRLRAALLVSLMLVLFFSYGQLYEYLRQSSALGFSVGRHRYLVAVYGFALAVGAWLIVRSRERFGLATPLINALTLALVVAPLIRIGGHEIRQARSSGTSPSSTSAVSTESLRDIYYIVLDGYTRGDALLEDLRYDNSAFLTDLERLGFYVAECARSNYARTDGALTSALNMEYKAAIQQDLLRQGLDPALTLSLIKDSSVRHRLEELGYDTVAFQTGYDWSNWRDADVYLSAALHPLASGRFSAFEALFLESTALRLWLDTRYALALSDDHDVGIRYGGHIELQLNILDQLPGIATLQQPTFTFAHILIPHIPYIFAPDGEIRSDPGFFSGEDSTPIDDRYERIGYTGGVEFVNGRILEIVESLIENSDPSPIIIIQGDHGLDDDNRFEVLSAFHFPGPDDPPLYSSITHVNTFRLLFDQYFGTDLGLLPDLSYHEDRDPTQPIRETSPSCVDEP